MTSHVAIVDARGGHLTTPALLMVTSAELTPRWLAWWQAQAGAERAVVQAEPLRDEDHLAELTDWGQRRAWNTPHLEDDLRRAAVDARRALTGLDLYDRPAEVAYWRHSPDTAPGLWYVYLPFALIE